MNFSNKLCIESLWTSKLLFSFKEKKKFILFAFLKMTNFTEKILWGYSILLQGLGFSFYTFATPVTPAMTELDPLIVPRYKVILTCFANNLI